MADTEDRLGSCAWLHDFFHPRESALFGVAALLCTALILTFLVEASEEEELEGLRHWAQLPWERVDCKVRKAGISYTGDCSNHSSQTMRHLHRPPSYNYSACAAPVGLPNGCSDAVRRAFAGTRRLAAADGVFLRPAVPLSSSSRVVEGSHKRRLRQRRPGAGDWQFDQTCYDRFVLWALMQVAGDEGDDGRCSYRTGLLGQSEDADWKRILVGRGNLDSGTKRKCWQLTLQSVGLLELHTCRVLALEDPRRWEEASAAWAQQQRNIRVVLAVLGVVLVILGIGVVVLHQWCWKAGVERWTDLLKPGMLFRIEDPLEGSESTRARLVRERWEHFRANVLADYQPRVLSAREYARVPATDLVGIGSSEVSRFPRGHALAPAQ